MVPRQHVYATMHAYWRVGVCGTLTLDWKHSTLEHMQRMCVCVCVGGCWSHQSVPVRSCVLGSDDNTVRRR